MPDERMDSIRQGIGVPPESPAAKRADEERRRRTSKDPPIEGAMGGTSDAETAGDEARMDAAREFLQPPEERTPGRQERRRSDEDH